MLHFCLTRDLLFTELSMLAAISPSLGMDGANLRIWEIVCALPEIQKKPKGLGAQDYTSGPDLAESSSSGGADEQPHPSN